MKILTIFGTRPEAIKMCPLVKKLELSQEINSIVCITGQHRDMVKSVMEVFEIKEDYNLEIMKERQTLTNITTRILEKLEPILDKEKPDIVLVHGDTTTSFAASLAAFYQKIPVGHVEAGLRSFNKYSPFPEEINRLLADNISEIHFAPTKINKENLNNEGITERVYITGNTIIDSFQYTCKEGYIFQNELLRTLEFDGKKTVLMTAHRRENLGQPIENICMAVRRITEENKDIQVVFPLHPNPLVRSSVKKILEGNEQVFLIEPLDVMDIHNLMAKCFFVLTDSGGIQEEAPGFGVPVLVARTETERPEAIEAGTAKIVGIEEENIYNNMKQLITDKEEYKKMAHAANPYGDGKASERIVEILIKYFKEK